MDKPSATQGYNAVTNDACLFLLPRLKGGEERRSPHRFFKSGPSGRGGKGGKRGNANFSLGTEIVTSLTVDGTAGGEKGREKEEGKERSGNWLFLAAGSV